jgi:hypothetical protein
VNIIPGPPTDSVAFESPLSSTLAPVLPVGTAPDLAGLEPMQTLKRRWPMVLGALITVAMIVALGKQLLSSGLVGLKHSVPTDPRFYIAFVLLYLSPVTGDYIIFRRLWRIPGAGFVALLKKRIANEVVLGYSGEAYFYAWARQRSEMVAAPFGAVKDVSFLSAIAGNAMTLTMMAIALPLGTDLIPPNDFRAIAWAGVIVICMSLPFLIFSKRVFSQDRRTLWWIFMIHMLRLIAGSVLIALAWHYALPTVSVWMWLFLSAGRLLVSRLPLVPNKDLLFANFAILLIGQYEALTQLVSVTAALTLLVHAALTIGFSVYALATRVRV